MEPPIPIAILASFEIVQSQLGNLERVVTKLVKLHSEMPAGEAINRLLDEISCLDVILEVSGNGVASVFAEEADL